MDDPFPGLSAEDLFRTGGGPDADTAEELKHQMGLADRPQRPGRGLPDVSGLARELGLR